jgi:protein phosphatase
VQVTTVDWILVVALVASLTSLGFLLTSKRKDAAPSPDVDDDVSDLGGPRPVMASSAEDAGDGLPPMPLPAEEAKEDPADLRYEEDAEVDPTRVGMLGAAPKRVVYQPPVERIVYDEDAATDEPTHAESLFLVHAAAQTDKGLRRKRNEDALLVLPHASLFIVADGMGGYAGGELASALAVKTMGEAFEKKSFEGPPHANLPREATELARALQMANSAILETATKRPDLEGMGTTICAARFSPNKQRLYIGHVGDSRCYRLRAGVFKQMTADHTMADHGVKGPESQQLSRAVGIWPTVPIDIVMSVPMPGDVFLLCSDGLTKMLDDTIIKTVLEGEQDPKAAVDRLILFANGRGGKDNITVVLVRVVAPGDEIIASNDASH